MRKISATDISKIQISGDLHHRSSLNMDRLEGKEYQLPDVFRSGKGKTYDWPADHEGRTILALALLSRVLDRKPRYLDEILSELPSHFNENGYMGRVLADGTIDEQQLSGHSWLLRGLCEHYLATGDAKSLDMAVTITNNLFLPTAHGYPEYPLDPKERIVKGEAAGNLTGNVLGVWRTSSDVGCAFIPIDGVTQVYQITGDPALVSLIEAMIAKFLEADLIGTSFQTHATLSACRGMLRYYETSGNAGILEAVERIFKLYMAEGITENYENYNWFGRPEWTEPCAVIDSFIVAAGLWKHTGNPRYLEDAHHIYFNGMGYELRPNGGWGCNMCAGARDEFLTPDPAIFEAWWCCLMRGGEGLARAAECLYFTGEDEIVVPFYADSIAVLGFADGEVEIKQMADYPVGGGGRFEVIKSSANTAKTLRLFVPGWTPAESLQLKLNGSDVQAVVKDGFAVLNTVLRSGDLVELSFDQGLRAQDPINKNNLRGFRTFRHGPLVLGIDNPGEPVSIARDTELEPLGGAKYRVPGTDLVLSPVGDLVYRDEKKAKSDRRQMLFRG